MLQNITLNGKISLEMEDGTDINRLTQLCTQRGVHVVTSGFFRMCCDGKDDNVPFRKDAKKMADVKYDILDKLIKENPNEAMQYVQRLIDQQKGALGVQNETSICQDVNLQTEQQKPIERKENLLDCAYFIISLYYLTDKKYMCTRTKVEKLLAIADLIAIYYFKNSLFEEKICSNDCGIGFPVLSRYLPSEIIMATDERCKYSDEPINFNYDYDKSKIPDLYSQRPLPCERTRGLLINVFRRFGSYSPVTIGKAIDSFKEKIISKTDREYNRFTIDEKLTQDYLSSPSNCGNINNEVLGYIIGYGETQ